MEHSKVIVARAAEKLQPILAHLNGEFDWQAEYEWAKGIFPDEIMEGVSADDYRRHEEVLRAFLKRFVDSWIDAGCDASEWVLEHPVLFSELQKTINSRQRRLDITPKGGFKI